MWSICSAGKFIVDIGCSGVDSGLSREHVCLADWTVDAEEGSAGAPGGGVWTL